MYSIFIASLLLIGCSSSDELDRETYDNTAWAVLRSSSTTSIKSLPPKDNASQINWTTSTPFLASVISTAQSENIPTEVALMPFLLSYYNNLANSTPEHSGIWQIKKSNCTTYYLACTEDYDERLHPVHSTLAVMKRLKTLNQYYLNWEESIEAFYREQHLFNKHALPELGTFMQGLSQLKYRVHYPLSIDDLSDISPEPYFVSLLIEKGVNISEVAQQSDIDTTLWQQLNSFNLHGMTTTQHHEILAPVNAINAINLPSVTDIKTTYIIDKIKSIASNILFFHASTKNQTPPKRITHSIGLA